MTRSFGGGPDREPRKREPELKEGGPGQWQRKLDSLSRYAADEETTVKPVRIETGKRLVALIIDFFVANVIAVLVSSIPLVSIFFFHHLTMVLVLLVRDYFFEGRGVGKNLMGLQVVDVMTGGPPTLLQSLKRNIVIVGPILVYYTLTAVLNIIPLPVVTEAAKSIINLVGTIYTVVVIPYEAYRAHSRADGLRFGDQFAGTAVIESNMDFSRFIPRQ